MYQHRDNLNSSGSDEDRRQSDQQPRAKFRVSAKRQNYINSGNRGADSGPPPPGRPLTASAKMRAGMYAAAKQGAAPPVPAFVDDPRPSTAAEPMDVVERMAYQSGMPSQKDTRQREYEPKRQSANQKELPAPVQAERTRITTTDKTSFHQTAAQIMDNKPYRVNVRPNSAQPKSTKQQVASPESRQQRQENPDMRRSLRDAHKEGRRSYEGEAALGASSQTYQHPHPGQQDRQARHADYRERRKKLQEEIEEIISSSDEEEKAREERRRKDEQRRLRHKEEQRKKRDAQVRQEQERRRQQDEARRREEEVRLRQQEEEEEEQRRLDEERRYQEELRRQRQREEQEHRRQQAEEEKQRKQQAKEERRRQREEEEKRREWEREERRRKKEEERRRLQKKAEEDKRRQREEDARRFQEEEEQRRLDFEQQEEERRRKWEEEQRARHKQFEEEQKKRQAELAARPTTDTQELFANRRAVYDSRYEYSDSDESEAYSEQYTPSAEDDWEEPSESDRYREDEIKPTSGGKRQETEPVQSRRVKEETKQGQRSRPSNPASPTTVQPPSVISNLVSAMSQMQTFLTTPVPKGTLMNCTIKRNKSGGNRIYPKYFLTVSDAGTFLLAAKKKYMKYIISSNENKCKINSSEYMGMVTNNMMGTEFRVFDSGVAPKKNLYNKRYIREELGCVLYKSNIVGKKGPRKMTILIPQVAGDGEPVVWKPESEADSMLAHHKAQENMGIQVFKNKKPIWNDTIGAYVLNFNGRVELASVKNFQLVDQFDANKIYLQFGRVDKHVFNLDFIWPFTPYQAFAIALTSIDFKLACE